MDLSQNNSFINRKRLVMIVEDEEINREMLGLIVGSEYDVVLAENGQEALEKVRELKNRLSLIMTDILMPVMDGYGLLEALQADEVLRRIPVIVLTSEKTAEVKSLRMGAVDFIPKPYDMPEVILARIGRSIKLAEDTSLISATETDALTGLYSKKFFLEHVDHFNRMNPGAEMDAAIVDIHHLHVLNELYGRAYGDEVIRRLADRVRHFTNERGGLAAYADGGKFLFYVPRTDDYAKALGGFATGLALNEKDASITLRMGVYRSESTDEDPEICFDRADTACGVIKNSYVTDFFVYDHQMREKELYTERLLGEIDTALSEKQFKVFYQPKYNIRGERPVLNSAEALVRWIHPTLGFISPGVFVPLFEKNGLILKLDKYVWSETARQIREWKDRFGRVIPVSVNISRMDMHEPGLEQLFCSLTSENDIDPGKYMLEITETAYTENAGHIVEKVKNLRGSGFKIEMDDFGSGYSSLNMLATLPIDVLKLDIGLVRNICHSRKDYELVKLMIDIADVMEIQTVAEGVETEEQYMLLKEAGCDVVQGYYFSKPVPPEEFESFILKEIEEEKKDAVN